MTGANRVGNEDGEDEDEGFETVPMVLDDVVGESEDEDDDDVHEEDNDDEDVGDDREKNSDGNDDNEDEDEDENEDDDEEEEDEDEDEDEEEEKREISKSLKVANKKHKKSGGFQSMGLSYPIYSGIIQKGYKIPTPIQRKAIPVIMERRDIVAMARTGSGKTAAFIIPLLERLKEHSARVGARAVILSPGRELALQTLKFVKELGKHTDLRACILVGGDSMDEQFAALATNPDIIIATPGRLMHLIIEMGIDLRTVEYVVFDEADRLFELGFAEQLREILFKLPESRQTLLFSATLPKLLVDFAKAGLNDPALIRLDVDTKISPDLEMMFLSVKAEEKDASLVYLLTSIIPATSQTIVFVATKHHVEYVHSLLTLAGLSTTYIFGSLDQVARKMHIARFREGDAKVLVVTDVAARGLDIPLLDCVVNYDFPGSSKIMVHRVGRAGRAGRKGRAFSLISSDELPYLVDFQLFSGRPLIYASVFSHAGSKQQQLSDKQNSSVTASAQPNYVTDIVLGQLPPSALDMDRERVVTWLKEDVTLQGYLASAKNGYRMYYKTRATASRESYTRAKEIAEARIGVHPYLVEIVGGGEVERIGLLEEIARFRPVETVFEVGRRGLKTAESVLMQSRRRQLATSIETKKAKSAEILSQSLARQKAALGASGKDVEEDYLQSSFTEIGASNKRKRTDHRDVEFYMSHYPRDAATERGYSVNASAPSVSVGHSGESFNERANEVAMDLTADDEDGIKKKKGNLVWDKKKKSFVRETVGSDNKKRIKTDSGASVAATFKSNRFEQWQKRTKINLPRAGEQELQIGSLQAMGGSAVGQRTYRHNTVTLANPKSKNFARKQAAAERADRLEKKSGKAGASASNVNKPTTVAIQAPLASKVGGGGGKNVRTELKSAAQIAKQRRIKEQRRQKTGRHNKKGKK